MSLSLLYNETLTRSVVLVSTCGLHIMLGNIDFCYLKPIFSTYLFRGVVCFSGAYGILLTFLVLIWYKIIKITCYLDPIIPFQTDIAVDIDIPIFRYSFFVLFKTDFANVLQNRYDILVYCTALLAQGAHMVVKYCFFLTNGE